MKKLTLSFRRNRRWASKRKTNKLTSKVKVFTKIQKKLTTLKDESEFILKLEWISPYVKIPKGLLLEGRHAIHDSIVKFERVRQKKWKIAKKM